MKRRMEMSDFRFAIMGAGAISTKFANAVSLIDGAVVCAVASRSTERAEAFAQKNSIPHAYGSYEEMLTAEKPDCVYIGATTDLHYPLSRLCIEHSIPVLCEKAMFTNSHDAEELFSLAKKKKVFSMEAMWSKFLPAMLHARELVQKGAIGEPVILNASLGFVADAHPEHRYFNPALGGGTAYDLTVYAFELSEYMLSDTARDIQLQLRRAETGVDTTNVCLASIGNCAVTMQSSIVSPLTEELVLSGTKGKIVIPNIHFTSECFLYDSNRRLTEHYIDTETENGFVFEALEAMRCIEHGMLESTIADHASTLRCARLFDLINGR